MIIIIIILTVPRLGTNANGKKQEDGTGDRSRRTVATAVVAGGSRWEESEGVEWKRGRSRGRKETKIAGRDGNGQGIGGNANKWGRGCGLPKKE
jgi:hypothetical protein